jgi:hypothetical protein
LTEAGHTLTEYGKTYSAVLPALSEQHDTDTKPPFQNADELDSKFSSFSEEAKVERDERGNGRVLLGTSVSDESGWKFLPEKWEDTLKGTFGEDTVETVTFYNVPSFDGDNKCRVEYIVSCSPKKCARAFNLSVGTGFESRSTEAYLTYHSDSGVYHVGPAKNTVDVLEAVDNSLPLSSDELDVVSDVATSLPVVDEHARNIAGNTFVTHLQALTGLLEKCGLSQEEMQRFTGADRSTNASHLQKLRKRLSTVETKRRRVEKTEALSDVLDSEEDGVEELEVFSSGIHSGTGNTGSG